MKARELFTLGVITFLLMNGITAIAQVLGMSPNPENNAVCPNVNITYTISNYNQSCHSISVINGIIIQDNDDGTLIVNWLDNGQKGSITVTRNSSGCTGIAPTQTFNAPIRTLALSTPTISGPAGPAAGFVLPLTYTAQLNWPFRGANDPDPFPVTSFDWILPAGWVNNTTPPTSASINVTTNIGGGGNITATGKTTCGSGAFNSQVATKTVNRTLSVPCPLIAQIPIERCGEPAQNGFAASSQPPGYSFNNPQWSWSLPQGWTFNGPSNSQFINVNTDGQHGGNVTATFSDYGVSASCPLNVPLVIANPGTFVAGNDRLCETQTYSLSSVPLPAGSTASWSVISPVVPVTPSGGSGTSAILTPSASLGAGSQAAITFTVSGCGMVEDFSKTVFVGRPNIINHKINGFPGTDRVVCPGWHTMSAAVLGDDTNPFCMTWELVNNNGTPPYSLYDVTCSSANIYINAANGSPAFVKVTATNECGTFQSFFNLFPFQERCDPVEYSLKIFPNPASHVLKVEVTSNNGEEIVPISITGVQLINMTGIVALDVRNVESSSLEMDVSNLAAGVYVARVQVPGELLTAKIQVTGLK